MHRARDARSCRCHLRGPQGLWSAGGVSAGEAPPGGTVRFGGGDADGGVECEAVQMPGRRSGARRAEWGGERVVLDLRRPAAGPVAAGDLLEGRAVGDACSCAVENEVDASSRVEIVHAGFAARLRDLRVPGLLVK